MKYIPLLLLTALPNLCMAVSPEISVSLSGPIKTLGEARDAIREQRKAGAQGPAVIRVGAGLYHPQETLLLEEQDSNLTIRAEGNDKPVFHGGLTVNEFKSYQGAILQSDLSGKITQGTKYRQLLVDGKRQPLARYPNFDASDPLYGGWAFVDLVPPEHNEGHQWDRTLYVKPADLRQWKYPAEVEINIFAGFGWWNAIDAVKSLDPASRLLTLEKPCFDSLHPHNRFYFQNALEELDAPGEWFLDPRTNILFLWPTQPIATHEVCLVTLDRFVEVKSGGKNIQLERLSFAGCNDAAIQLSNAENCTIVGCTLDTVGAWNGHGIVINGGRHNIVRSNDIAKTGGHGILLTGGERKTLTASEHEAVNNQISEAGVFMKTAAGVKCQGVGMKIAHNLIHDCPRMGVEMRGNNIIIEYNHLHHLCMETQDGGALYTGGRDWIGGRGSVWRYNRIHDVVGCGQEADGLKHPWFTCGMYPDDNSGGLDIIGNLVYRVADTCLHMHNARDCRVENNIFANAGNYQFDMHGWNKNHAFLLQHIGSMIRGYESVVGQPAWKGMRGMELHPRDAIRDDLTMMSGNVVERNIMASNALGVKYADIWHCSPKWNSINRNLVWNGVYPVTTNVSTLGPDVEPPIWLAEFDANPVGVGIIPPGWGFNHRPKGTDFSVLDGVLKVDCALSADPANPRTVLHGPDVPLKPGAAYRVRMRVKSTEPESSFSLGFASIDAKEGYWQLPPTRFVAKSDWQEIEATGKMPQEGDKNWKPWLKNFWLRLDCYAEKGQLLIDQVRISEVIELVPWAAWQNAGWDKEGLVADPKFLDATKDDFRLQEDSPALKKLGFQVLPIDKMGLVKDAWRKL